MLDPIQLPILMKAIDFVFEEGRKILEERRERRKTPELPTSAPEPEKATELTLPESPRVVEIKQDLLASKIDDLLWQNNEAEVKHLVKLLETYSKNYQLSQEQYAKWGSALVPPIIVHNMTEAENSMLKTLKQLEDVLSKVYKKDFNSNQ